MNRFGSRIVHGDFFPCILSGIDKRHTPAVIPREQSAERRLSVGRDVATDAAEYTSRKMAGGVVHVPANNRKPVSLAVA